MYYIPTNTRIRNGIPPEFRFQSVADVRRI